MSQMTMQEIARLSGVSLATVSRTIKNPQLVRPKTRERVLSMMAEHNYVYHATAADLSRRKSSVIGVTIPTTRNPVFASSSLAIQEIAQKKGFSIILGNTHHDAAIERQLLQSFQERHVAGMILTGFTLHQEAYLNNLARAGIPCLVIWEKLDEPWLSYIGFDNFKAARSMTEYLISLKHRRIGLIIGPFSKIGRVKKRLDGYRSALQDHNIAFDPDLVIEKEPLLYDGKEAMTRLMFLPKRPTAVFAASDMLAIGALSAAWDLGFNVPQDVSIAGFDDIDFAAYCSPPMTTVRVPSHEIGRLAAKYLIEAIEQGSMPLRHHCLDTDIVVRNTCSELR
ncbi:MAG: LacI family DNA-binding transcriptional regulator [Deltaproteobacteria bacterium]|nr:MAG: LacI family DNA-binding transcriptional regulator [Deltaproteobacteria bacterium]